MFLAVGLLAVLLFAGTAVAAVEIDGDFSGTLVGYGDDAEGEFGNEITVEGELTVEGERAVDPTIDITSGPETVLDTSSVEVLVPGDTSIDFRTLHSADTVRLTADEIPEGTTIDLSYTVYLKGTAEDSIDAGQVTIEYETAGGTPGQESFGATTDTSNSADNVISRMEDDSQLATWQWYLSWVGAAALIILVIGGAVAIFGGRSGPGKSKP